MYVSGGDNTPVTISPSFNVLRPDEYQRAMAEVEQAKRRGKKPQEVGKESEEVQLEQPDEEELKDMLHTKCKITDKKYVPGFLTFSARF